MIVEYTRYKIDTAQQSNFIEAYKKASVPLENSDFCLGYELTQCEEEPENFILRIKWSSTDDHLNGFRNSPEFMDFLEHVRPFYQKIEEMNHYSLTEVTSTK